ncbi:MAG TPA: non-canonical purine NTP pyrophosphatase [Verrucomicrobiae bacterium]|nr:non-canonical purine NTP pyrophosphatase [Verrucomicrobiae bacterium]
MTLLILATRNEHKILEIRDILGAGFQFLTLRDLPPSPVLIEDRATFEGNAARKALQLAQWLADLPAAFNLPTGQPCYVLADDSGLEVDALQGAPGVHSARFAHLDRGLGGNASDADNNAKLLRLLADVPLALRSARFRCSIALAPLLPKTRQNSSPVCSADEAETQLEIFSGRCEGVIDLAAQGEGGFGYDPLFIPKGYKCSFALLAETEKNRISHRADALRKLRDRLR